MNVAYIVYCNLVPGIAGPEGPPGCRLPGRPGRGWTPGLRSPAGTLSGLPPVSAGIPGYLHTNVFVGLDTVENMNVMVFTLIFFSVLQDVTSDQTCSKNS